MDFYTNFLKIIKVGGNPTWCGYLLTKEQYNEVAKLLEKNLEKVKKKGSVVEIKHKQEYLENFKILKKPYEGNNRSK